LPYEAAMKRLFSTVTQVVQANGYKIYAAKR
jgi:16S rRNA G1207 methylase RsmC